MLQFSGLGDPCSPGDADYNPNDPICAAFYAPATAAGGTSQSGTCNTDSDCSNGMECNAISWFCEPSGAQGSSKQVTSSTSSTSSANPPLNPTNAIQPGAAAALPMSSTKIALVLLAIMGAAGIGWVAYSQMKRSKA